MMAWKRLLLFAAAWAGLDALAASVEKIERLPEGWKQLIGSPDARSVLQMSIALRQPNMEGLEAMIASDTRPSRRQIQMLRAPEQEERDAVLRWLRENGVRETKTDADWIHVRLTVAKAEKLLSMQLRQYSFRGQTPVLRTKEYSVPDDVSKAVNFVHPIANFMTPEHDVASLQPLPADLALQRRGSAALSCTSLTTPDCITKLYNISYVAPNGTSPVRFAVAGFLEQYANFVDTQAFFRRSKPALAGYNFSVELVNGGENPQDPAKAGGEANLDMQYAMALGFPAQMSFISTGGRGVKLNDSGKPAEYSDNEPYLELLEYLLAKPDNQLPHVLSMSYGDDELSVPRPYAEKVCCLLGMLTSRGTSIIMSSGDGGARGGQNATCRTNDGTNKEVTIASFPASCPWVTAVGATTNYRNPSPGAVFSTGGFSQYFKRPAWQDAAVEGYVKQLGGTLQGFYDPNMRAIPDISAVGTRFLVMVGGTPSQLDGTSASAPTFAALIALINDARLRAGKRSLGWLNQRLYTPSVQQVLRDVTEGTSTPCRFSAPEKDAGWPARPGWDAITGLGTPNRFDDLLRVLSDA